MPESNLERLGRLVRLRRTQLRIHTAKALADAAHVTPRVVSDLEVGRRANFSGNTKAAIEDALLWGAGSIDDTLAGGEPRPLETAPPDQRGGQEHPGIKAGVPIQSVAETLSKIIDQQLGAESASRGILHRIRALRNSGLGPLSTEEDEQVMSNLLRETENMRSVITDEIVKIIATAYSDNAEDVARVFGPLLSKVMQPPPPYSDDDSKRDNVTRLADRRSVPPPPDTDDLDVAASRREKQSDGERGDDK